ncbi:MAG: hypothetical protein AAB074_01435 [Planctomycetota bacterium]
MKSTSRWLLLAAVFVFPVSGCSSTEPAAPNQPEQESAKVLGKVAGRLFGATGITVEALVSVGGGGGKNFLRTTWAEPGVYREERWDGEAPEGEPASVQICDGTTTWLYFPGQKKFYEMAIASGDLDRKPFVLGFTREGRLAVMGIESGREEELVFGAGSLCMPIAGGGKLAVEADADVSGQLCHVLTYRVGTMVQTFFISKADSTPLRFMLESSFEHKGKTFTTTAVSDLKRLDAMSRPDAAMFRFVPPEGATKAAKAGEDKLLAAGGDAPELGAVDASGKPVNLADFKGKVVLLNFWFLG